LEEDLDIDLELDLEDADFDMDEAIFEHIPEEEQPDVGKPETGKFCVSF